MFSVAVLPTGKNSIIFQLWTSSGRNHHPVVIVVSPWNALDQIDVKKHENASRKTYSFLEVKLRQSLKKSWTKINIIFVKRTVLADSFHQIAGRAQRHNIECK